MGRIRNGHASQLNTTIDCGSWTVAPQMQVAPDLWRPMTWITSAYGQMSTAGIKVTEDTALGHTALWHGLQLIGGDAGTLERSLKKQQGDGFTDVTNHAAYELVNEQANAWMLACDFWEMMVPRAIMHGNAIAEISRNGSGKPLSPYVGGGMIPLPPETTFPWMDPETDRLWIKTREYLPNGKLAPERLIDPDDTFHLRGLSTDGFWGRSLLMTARDRIANGLGMLEQSNRFMDNGMKPDWMISFDVPIDAEDRIAYEEQMRLRNKGISNTGNTLFMDNGARATPLGMTNEAAEFVDLNKLDIVMVASLLNIPANMLNAMIAMTFSNVEESERWYINRTLRRWLFKIHKEARAKLLTLREQKTHKFETNLDPLLMGRLAERYSAYSSAISAMWLRRNEVREMEGLNPDPEMDEIMNPNTTSGGTGSEEQEQEQEQVERAAKLRHIIEREDREVSRACRDNRDVLQWLDRYYHHDLMPRMMEVAPYAAEHYAKQRFNLWRKCVPHVKDRKALGSLVEAQKQTAPERVSALLHGANGYATTRQI